MTAAVAVRPRGAGIAVAALGAAALWLGAALRAEAQGFLPREVTDILGTPSPQMPPDRDARQAAEGDYRAILGEPELARPTELEADRRAYALGSKLRCPVCQGVAVSDSPAGMAASMRAQVRDLVALGYSDEQVFQYFEKSYGEFVRLDPPARGINWLLWVAPGVALALGAGFVWNASRRNAAAPEAKTSVDAPATQERRAIDPELEPFLEQVRRDLRSRRGNR